MSNLLDCHNDEVERIEKLGRELSYKWRLKTRTLRNLEEFATEAKGRFLDIGFIVNVDITPALISDNIMPDIAVVGRVTPVLDFDHDKRRAEVRKQYEQEGKLSHGKLKKHL